MTTLAAQERATYEAIWDLPQYANHSPAERFAPLMIELLQAGTVLDAGCGSGKGALALKAAGFDVTLCDLTRDGLLPEAQDLPFVATSLWDDLAPVAYLGAVARGYSSADPRFEWVVCCDVLEHIPTQFTMLVVRRLLDVARKGVFLSISLSADWFGALVGTELHKTVKDYEWWRHSLAELATVVDARDLQHEAVFLLRKA